MKTLRLFGMLLMAVTLSFGISACGGDDDDDGDNGTQTSDPNVQSVVGSWNIVYYTSIRRYSDGQPDEQKVHNETPPYDRVVFYQDGRCEYWEYDGDSDYQGTARYRVDSDGNQYHEDGSFTYTQNGTNITCKSDNSDDVITIKNYDGKNKMSYEWNIREVKGSVIVYKYYTGELERVIGSSSGTSGNDPSGDDTTNMCPDGNHPHMIDLGLPSGTKWACCNIGATKPDGYGNFYAWGETSTKSEYSWETYMYGSSKDSTAYIGNDIAGTQYDAATVNWRGLWRMPSLTQCQELIDNTTYKWTTLNGVRGGKFTAKNGKSIFLPASGLWWNTGLGFVGNNADYLSSTINKTQYIGTYAYAIYIQSIDEGYGISEYQTLSNGACVRPVQGGNNGGNNSSDLTSLVAISQSAWHAGGVCGWAGPEVTTSDGRKTALMEVYQETTQATGEVMWQEVAGLPNGGYLVELYANAYFTPYPGLESTISEGAKDVVYVEANKQRRYMTVHIGTSFTESEVYSIDTNVNDSTLRISMSATKPGTNWYTIQIKKLTKTR